MQGCHLTPRTPAILAGTDREFLVSDAPTLSREYCRVVRLE
jgi:hypothetical protein